MMTYQHENQFCLFLRESSFTDTTFVHLIIIANVFLKY